MSSYIFPEDMNFYFFDFNHFHQYYGFIYYKKLMVPPSIKYYQQFFDLELFKIVCLRILLTLILD